MQDMKECALPQQVATGLGKATEGMVGATYLLVLYVGQQIVHGINHAIICKVTQSDQDRPESLVMVILNEIHDGGSLTGEWKIVDIQTILP